MNLLKFDKYFHWLADKLKNKLLGLLFAACYNFLRLEWMKRAELKNKLWIKTGVFRGCDGYLVAGRGAEILVPLVISNRANSCHTLKWRNELLFSKEQMMMMIYHCQNVRFNPTAHPIICIAFILLQQHTFHFSTFARWLVKEQHRWTRMRRKAPRRKVIARSCGQKGRTSCQISLLPLTFVHCAIKMATKTDFQPGVPS